MAQEAERHFLGRFWDWLTLADYDEAKRQRTNTEIARYGRGNVLFQNGAVLDDVDSAKLAKAGDRAAKRLKKRLNIA
jgi:hypothetical protein